MGNCSSYFWENFEVFSVFPHSYSRIDGCIEMKFKVWGSLGFSFLSNFFKTFFPTQRTWYPVSGLKLALGNHDHDCNTASFFNKNLPIKLMMCNAYSKKFKVKLG